MLQITNLELYKNKISEFLNNEFVYAQEWELLEDPLLVPVYVDSNGKLTLEKQTELRAATKARDYLHFHIDGVGLLNNTTFESLVFPNLESVPTVPRSNGPFYFSLHGCSHIKNLYFPQLKKLGNYGMRHFVQSCPNLSKMEFPKLESIETYVFESNFYKCPNLKDIYFPSLISAGQNAFTDCGTGVKLHFKKSLEGNSQFTTGYLGLSNASQIVFDI